MTCWLLTHSLVRHIIMSQGCIDSMRIITASICSREEVVVKHCFCSCIRLFLSLLTLTEIKHCSIQRRVNLDLWRHSVSYYRSLITPWVSRVIVSRYFHRVVQADGFILCVIFSPMVTIWVVYYIFYEKRKKSIRKFFNLFVFYFEKILQSLHFPIWKLLQIVEFLIKFLRRQMVF